jgi:hypothetical protein
MPHSQVSGYWDKLLDMLKKFTCTGAVHISPAGGPPSPVFRNRCQHRGVCKLGREAVRYDDCLWKELCCSKFNMPRHASLGDPGVSWRDLYR